MENLNIKRIGQELLRDQEFVGGLLGAVRQGKHPEKESIGLGELIEEVRDLLHALVRQQL